MEHTTFLGHYRISVSRDGTPHELGRAGAAITYKAANQRSGDPLSLKLIPIANIDPEVQKQFEEQARPAQQLHHFNIAKVLDFGKEAGQFVYVSEYLEGETVDSWIEEHGPMPPDAVLRVAAQVVSALSAASFHRLTHRAIQPSNLLIVPGPTAEGGWPFVKLVDVSSAGPKLHSHSGEAPDVDSVVSRQFASPEQLQHGTVDFRSAIYSLGATMYFLLTGAAPPAKVRLRDLRRFPKALRNLLAHMLHGNPDKRPQDLAALEKEILKCLGKIEKRHAFGRKLGIPLAVVTSKEPKTPPTQADTSGQGQATSPAQANVAPQPGTASDATSSTQKENAAGLASNRARTGQSFLDQRDAQLPRGRGRSARARVVGITSDGKLIFRLPSGRRMIVAPDSEGEGELVPQGHRRSYMERGQTGPQPQFGQDYPPYD